MFSKYSAVLMEELTKFDHAAFEFVNSKLQCKFLDFCVYPISYCDSMSFNVSFFVILIISIAILWKNKKDNFWNTIALLLSALAITVGITYFLKYYFERSRPAGVFGIKNINTLFEKIYESSFSFPSGHTSIAVSVCTFMLIAVKRYWYLYILFAFFSGFYRIYTGTHFPSDVLCGALIGVISAYLTVKLFKCRKGSL
jgi:undecaprenyl-diphosphatase